MIFYCGRCRTEFNAKPSARRRFCSTFCANESNKGSNNYGWVGGKLDIRCLLCARPFKKYQNYILQNRGLFCSHSCATRVRFSGRPKSQDHIEKMRKASTGRRMSKMARLKIRIARSKQIIGPRSEAAKQKTGAALRGRPNPRWAEMNKSEEHRALVSAALRGRPKSEEHRAKLSAYRQSIRMETRAWTIRGILEGRISPTNLSGRRYEYLDRKGRLWAFRSSWEYRVAVRLDELFLSWEYEPHRLLLSSGHIYIPDFWVVEWQTYLEIKGWQRGVNKVAIAITDGYPVRPIRNIWTWLRECPVKISP